MYRRACLTGGGALALSGCGAAPPRVIVQTEYGPIAIDVFVGRAPASARGFLAVVDSGGYAGGAFIRVVRPDNDHGTPVIGVVQGHARAGVTAPHLVHESTLQTGLRHLDGTVSLTRDAPGTASGIEFFVCVGAQPALDHGGLRNPDGQGFAAFDRVTSGMDVVRRIWVLPALGASADRYTAGQVLSPAVGFSVRRV